MDIEAIVKKHLNAWRVSLVFSPEACIRAALTELAAGYEQRIANTTFDLKFAQERIRQLEGDLDEAK